ncbi:glycosyltransferase [Nonlabens ponticola]|uniref:Glycosyltransferase n=1 Tax=Nonlabens ponticola TaxID=2496866 RepID=A0A3S9MXB1_9FLAO|nr:glycosyltransferase [Nonlabens ponticola]AZQ43881.1 glycosyltransferase [Nonlabens ponticola]
MPHVAKIGDVHARARNRAIKEHRRRNDCILPSRMRIVQLIDSLHPGGAERMAVNIANELAGRGIASHLIATREEGILKDTLSPKVSYLHANRQGKVGMNGIMRMRAFLKEQKITHIHAHSSSYLVGGILKLLLPEVKLIWHDHYGARVNSKASDYRGLRFLSRRFNSIIAVSEPLKKWSQRELNCDQVFYFANFVQSNDLKGNYRKTESDEVVKIVCLANLRPDKDHENLIRAFKICVESNQNIELSLIGKVANDDYSNKIEELINELDLNERIVIHGEQNNIQQLLHAYDIAILSSRSEGLPIALLEYGAAALPVVCTDVGQCKDVLNDCGIIVPSENSEALSVGLMTLVDNPDLRKTLAHQFIAQVLSNHGSDSYIRQLLPLYQ